MEDIEAANRLKPDFIGFVFAPKSSRYVTPLQAIGLKEHLDPEIRAIGVFTDQPLELMADLAKTGVIDGIQLHGNQEEADIKTLRTMTAVPIFRAFKVQSADDIEKAKASSADYILLDAGAGEGRSFDWSLLEAMDKDYILAGGLSPDNIQEALEKLHPFGVDVSSGIETDKRKDPEKMEAFCKIVRGEQDEQ